MSKHSSKYFLLLILIFTFSTLFTASYTSQSVNDLAYAVAIGIDTGSNNNLKITFQFTKSNSSGEGSSDVSPTITNSVESPSIDSGINLMNTYISKEINLSHCKIIVFSEEVASRGISKEIYSLMNKIEIRPDANVVVSKCDAKDFIENSKPILENLVTKYYEKVPISSQYTGYTANIKLGDFFNRLKCNACESVAILGGINTGTSNSFNNSLDTFKQSSDKSSDSDSEKPEIRSETFGLAVFKNDKLVGELKPLETLSYLIIRNEFKNSTITVPSGSNSDEIIDLYLYQQSDSKVTADIINGSPYFKINVSLNARILSIGDTTSNLTQEKLDSISDSISSYLKETILNYLYKTSKEFGSDITGFGKHILSKFLTQEDFTNYNWSENYKNSFFDVTVNTHVKSEFLLIGT